MEHPRAPGSCRFHRAWSHEPCEFTGFPTFLGHPALCLKPDHRATASEIDLLWAWQEWLLF